MVREVNARVLGKWQLLSVNGGRFEINYQLLFADDIALLADSE